MRITIATGPLFPVPPLLGGAVPRLWQGVAEQFAARGHEVTVFARAFPSQPSTETIRGVRYQRWGGFSQSLNIAVDLVKDFSYAVGAVKRLPAADILVTNDLWLPALAGLLRKSAGRVIINANRFPKGQYWLYSRAARIVAVSRAVRDAIVRQCPRLTERTLVIPNPTDVSLFSPPEQSCDRGGSAKTLLYTGRLHPEKGLHLLVEAFAMLYPRHPAIQLRLVGPAAENQGGGGTRYKQALEELARGLPVELSGPVFEMQTLAEVYQAADLFCYPSLAEKGEAFGVAPLEAMACGLAPIVSKLDCFSDFIREGETGYCFDHRQENPAKALATKLEEALNNWGRTVSMGKRASEAAQRFSYPCVADSYLADFDNILSGRSMGPVKR